MDINVLVADDHHLVRIGLEMVTRQILGSNIRVDSAQNGKEVLEKLEVDCYDMLITDLNMPYTNGFELISSALAKCPLLKILVITINPEEVFASHCLRVGAYGFVNKEEPDTVLQEAIRTIAKGKRYITGNQAELFTNSFLYGAPANPFGLLSARELEVVMLLLKGHGALEVANTLSINISTASSYRARIFDKLEIKNLMQLNRLARLFHLADDLLV